MNVGDMFSCATEANPQRSLLFRRGEVNLLVWQASKTNVTNSNVIHACLCSPLSIKAEAKDNGTS